MSYEIRLARSYKRDYKKLSFANQGLVDDTIRRLASGETLEPKYKDHKLKGEYKGTRECHVSPDLLLIYQKHEDVLVLYCLRIGSHSELF